MLRWISGVIIAVFVVLILLYLPREGVEVIVVLCSMQGLWEYFNATRKADALYLRIVGVILGGLVTALIIFWARLPDQFLAIFAGSLIFSFLIHFKGSPDFTVRLRNTVFFLFGIMYVSVLCAYWGWVRGLEVWRFWVFLMLGATFCTDVGGYLFGKWIGKHKLAPHLSPGKTIEGYLGGIIFALLAVLVVRQLFWPDYPTIKLLTIGLLIGLIAPLGDLSESLIKRGTGVKDSGQLIPGHGGFLDRVDALLFTGPVVYYFAKYFG